MDNRESQIALRAYIAGLITASIPVIALQTYPAWVVGLGMFALLTIAGGPVWKWVHGPGSAEAEPDL